MIGWIQGKVVRRDAAGLIIVDSGGVGYELRVSIQTLASVPGPSERVTLWVHTNVREDAITLFGFADLVEKQLFRMLTSVPKVGPRHAVAVLGGFPARELIECIAGRESGKLVKIPGIGKKTAEQIVLTLGDKVLTLLEVMRAEAGEGPSQTELLPEGGEDFEDAAREVLTSLGWKGKAVERALTKVSTELGEGEAKVDLDALVRATLAELMSR